MTNVKQIKRNISAMSALSDEDLELLLFNSETVSFRLGFELEFHSLNGVDREDLERLARDRRDEDREIDWERARECASNHIDDGDVWNAFLSELDDERYDDYINEICMNLMDYIAISFRKTWLRQFFELAEYCCNSQVYEEILDILSDIRGDLIDAYMNNMDLSSFEMGGDDDETTADDFREHGKIPDICNVKFDGSVKGGEITSVGPNTPKNLLNLVRKLFCKGNQFNIDTGCSFHLHVSVDGVKHSYGENLQAELMLYCLSQYSNWPESLQQRLYNTKYYQIQTERKKYSFINFNRDYNTWEFRIFGNISNVDDAKYCMLLAMKAFIHSYSVQLEYTKSLAAGGNFVQYLANEVSDYDGNFNLQATVERYVNRNANAA